MTLALLILGAIVVWGVGTGVCVVVATPQIQSASDSTGVYICAFLLWPMVLPMLITINTFRARAARRSLPSAAVNQPDIDLLPARVVKR